MENERPHITALDYGPHLDMKRIIERSKERNPALWPDTKPIRQQSRS
jgi:hypothetical protein